MVNIEQPVLLNDCMHWNDLKLISSFGFTFLVDEVINVMFLADNCRTAYIKKPESLLPYVGKSEYEHYCKEALAKNRVCY